MINTKRISALAAWYGTSYFFLQNPHYLHVKKSKLDLPKKDIYLMSHRGGSMENPENTL
jgi:glycerophosphoryl diester phosphodiesterase